MRLLVAGLPGSGVPSTALAEGRTATIVGIVKRPYPTASDRRYAIVPRSGSDVTVGGAASSTARRAPARRRRRRRALAPGPGTEPATVARANGSTAPDIDLRELAAHAGTAVRVGGIVTDVDPLGFRLDDGTATARVLLEDGASDLLALVAPGDALNATGIPTLADEVALVVVDPAGVVLLGDLDGTGEAAGVSD